MNIKIIINDKQTFSSSDEVSNEIKTSEMHIKSFKILKQGVCIAQNSGKYSEDMLFDTIDELEEKEKIELKDICRMCNSWDDRQHLEAAIILADYSTDYSLSLLMGLAEHRQTLVRKRAFSSLSRVDKINQDVEIFLNKKLFDNFWDMDSCIKRCILTTILRFKPQACLPGLKKLFGKSNKNCHRKKVGTGFRPSNFSADPYEVGVHVLSELKLEYAIV